MTENMGFNNIRIVPWLHMLLLIVGVPLFPQNLHAEYPRRNAVVEAVQKVSPAVVNISSEVVVRRQASPFSGFGLTPGFDNFFHDFFNFRYNRNIKRSSLGSGIIIDGKRKLVLTNTHVIAKSADITVTLMDERDFSAIVVGADPDSDLAVLKIDTDKPLPDIEMGNSNDLMIGETVIAIGNPFGFQHTVTTGVISSVNRSIQTENRIFHNFIQTDASINPGNSGGPLLNINGQLIGINTAIVEKAQGIGFAIPIDKAKRIISDLIKYGEVVPAWTGIIIQDINDQLAHYLNMPGQKGVVVKKIEQASPAQQTGIQEGDLIVAVDTRPVENSDDFSAVMKGIGTDQTIVLTVLRKGNRKSFSIHTKMYPIENALSLTYELLGIKVQNVKTPQTPFHRKRSGNGVEITSLHPGSYLYKIGAAPGDIISQINEQTIENLDDLKKAIVKYRTKQSIVILLIRSGQGYYITVPL